MPLALSQSTARSSWVVLPAPSIPSKVTNRPGFVVTVGDKSSGDRPDRGMVSNPITTVSVPIASFPKQNP
jgi:hypothetical protein